MELFIVFVNNARKLNIKIGKNMTKVVTYLNLVIPSSNTCHQSYETSIRKMKFFVLSSVPVFALFLRL